MASPEATPTAVEMPAEGVNVVMEKKEEAPAAEVVGTPFFNLASAAFPTFSLTPRRPTSPSGVEQSVVPAVAPGPEPGAADGAATDKAQETEEGTVAPAEEDKPATEDTEDKTTPAEEVAEEPGNENVAEDENAQPEEKEEPSAGDKRPLPTTENPPADGESDEVATKMAKTAAEAAAGGEEVVVDA